MAHQISQNSLFEHLAFSDVSYRMTGKDGAGFIDPLTPGVDEVDVSKQEFEGKDLLLQFLRPP